MDQFVNPSSLSAQMCVVLHKHQQLLIATVFNNLSKPPMYFHLAQHDSTGAHGEVSPKYEMTGGFAFPSHILLKANCHYTCSLV